MPKSALRAVLGRMKFTIHATRRIPHGASRLVQAISAWLVKTRRAPSRHNRDARAVWSYGYGHAQTEYTPPPSPPPLISPPPPPLALFCMPPPSRRPTFRFPASFFFAHPAHFCALQSDPKNTDLISQSIAKHVPVRPHRGVSLAPPVDI